ncbi:MAG: exodeoxyribonuclease VII large subunit, partial [Pseudomonadota bacterium]
MRAPAQHDVWSVSALNRASRELLESSFGSIWVEAEVSNLARPASGHVYFSLKDGQAQVRAA